MTQLEFLSYTPGAATYRVTGGPARLLVTFYKTDDLDEDELEARENLASAIAETVRSPTRARARNRPNHERARAAIERAGARARAGRSRARERAAPMARADLLPLGGW